MGRSLISGLPDEIVWQCLVRVELNSGHNIALVCKSWNAALKNPQIYSVRKRLKISEKRVCLILNDIRRIQLTVAVNDPINNSCKYLPRFPARNRGNYHCHFVKRRLVLISDDDFDHIENSVWLFDFSRSQWQRGANMPKGQMGFASAADEDGGLIYIGPSYTSSTLVYNVEVDKWDFLPDINTHMRSLTSVFADGKFYVMNQFSVLVFDPSSRSWTTMDGLNCMESQGMGIVVSGVPFVTAFDGGLYCFSYNELIQYDRHHNKLIIVGTLPTHFWGLSIKFALGLGNRIFVCRGDLEFYVISPPSEKGGAVECIRQRRLSDLDGYLMCATILEL